MSIITRNIWNAGTTKLSDPLPYAASSSLFGALAPLSNIPPALCSIILTSGTLAPLSNFSHELLMPFNVQLQNAHIVEPHQVGMPDKVMVYAVLTQVHQFDYSEPPLSPKEQQAFLDPCVLIRRPRITELLLALSSSLFCVIPQVWACTAFLPCVL